MSKEEMRNLKPGDLVRVTKSNFYDYGAVYKVEDVVGRCIDVDGTFLYPEECELVPTAENTKRKRRVRDILVGVVIAVAICLVTFIVVRFMEAVDRTLIDVITPTIEHRIPE